MTEPAPIRVLVVDDDYRVAAVQSALVARVAGYTVVGTAHTAAEALTLTRQLRPDLVLMDIYLPDGSGLDVVRSLRLEPEPPDVIVISAARELASVRTAMQLGAVHYLVKPFGFKALAERLTSYQRLRQSMAELPTEAEQADVDRLYATLRQPAPPERRNSTPTLELVLSTVRKRASDMSAAEVAEVIGISRATAQRYLNHLEEDGQVKRQLRYGSAGRPEHRYRPL